MPVTSAPPGTRAPRVPIPSEIWVLVGAAFVIAIGFGIVSPVLPAYARSFDVGVAAASVIVSAFAFFRLVFAPAGGVLVEKLGERPVYLAGLIVVALSSLAAAFAQSYWQLLLFRGVGGIGSTMFTISAMALLVRLAPPVARGRVSSAYGAAFLIGGMAGPLLGGLVAQWGLRAPFIVYAVALFIAAGVVAVGLGGARLRPAPDAASRPAMTLAQAWTNRAYRAVIISGVANGWTNFGVRMAVLPLLAAAVMDEPWVAGVVLAVGAVGTAVTLQFSGGLVDRVGRRPLVIAGMATMAVTFGSMGLVTLKQVGTSAGLALLLALALVSGVGAGMVNPAQQATVADVVGNDRSGGRVLSTFQMAQDGGAILGPILVGLVADTLGFTAAFAVTGLVCAIGLLPWLRAPEPMHQHP